MKLRLCPGCWIKVEPLLGRAALDERAHLETIARKLTSCSSCRLQGNKLRAFVRAKNSAAWESLDTFIDGMMKF